MDIVLHIILYLDSSMNNTYQDSMDILIHMILYSYHPIKVLGILIHIFLIQYLHNDME